jgi:PEP-CTERM motif
MKTKLLGLALLLAHVASAGVLISLSPSVQTTPPGGIADVTCGNGTLQCLIFSGTITPDAMADTLLNAISISFVPPTGLLTSIDAFFFSNVPGLLLSTDSAYTGPIFAVDVAANIAPGTYLGTLTLLGGASELDRDTLVSAPFQVVVTPEPATWYALLGLGAILVFARR